MALAADSGVTAAGVASSRDDRWGVPASESGENELPVPRRATPTVSMVAVPRTAMAMVPTVGSGRPSVAGWGGGHGRLCKN